MPVWKVLVCARLLLWGQVGLRVVSTPEDRPLEDGLMSLSWGERDFSGRHGVTERDPPKGGIALGVITFL